MFPLSEIQASLFSRVNGDSTLQTLLGGSGRFFHAFGPEQPKRGSVRYFMQTGLPGSIAGDNAQTHEHYFEFHIFADNYNAIAERLHLLLHHYRFAGSTNAGGAWCQQVWIGPDSFDEDLKVGRKDLRFRVFVIPKAQAPV